MTIDRETVIRLAREVGFRDAVAMIYARRLERFAAMVLERGRKPLTDEQIGMLSTTRTFAGMHPDYLRDCVMAIEAAHGITNKENSDA